MDIYSLTNEDYQKMFKGIAKDTYIFDDIQFNVDCVRQELGQLLSNDDENISSTAYHMAKIINLLTYFKIVDGKPFTDES